MGAIDIRHAVEDFKKKTGFGNKLDECFVPWYLKKAFGLSEIEAISHSAETTEGLSGPGYDFNIDGFYIENDNKKNPPVLYLIQGKYSNTLSYITKGFRDFKKSIEWLKRFLFLREGVYTRENRVLVKLRSDLSNLEDEVIKQLKFEFIVINLSEEDDAILNNRTREVREEIEDLIRDSFPDRLFTVRQIGAFDLEDMPMATNQPSPTLSLRFRGTSLESNSSNTANMYHGIGYLSDLVEIYRLRKDDFFSKNVRYFLNTRKNVEKGPSGKIKETLKKICINQEQPFSPTLFALYHNGITLYAKFAKRSENNNDQIEIKDPYVLNGCQTIKTAYLFRHALPNSLKIDDEKWKNIHIPLRIIQTSDESLLREITVSNNRQNSISASALRANDSEQIKLEHRFAEKAIFYERQEDAFEYLQDTNYRLINKNFFNSEEGPVYIEDIGRSLCAVAGEMSFALHLNDLFESDTAYKRCFCDKRVSSITFLVFLQNVHNVLGVVLKNDLGLQWDGSVVKSGRIFYHVMYLLVRYLVKKKCDDVVLEFGGRILGKSRQLREVIAKQLDNYHSGLKKEIIDKFMQLENNKSEEINAVFNRISSKLRLDSIDPFDYYKNIDNENL